MIFYFIFIILETSPRPPPRKSLNLGVLSTRPECAFPRSRVPPSRKLGGTLQITQRKQEQLVSDLEVPVRIHPYGVVLNIASETLDQRTYSLWVAVSVKCFEHISRTERYILEIPLPFNNQPHLTIYIKIHQEAPAKHSQALHLALVLV